MIFTSCVALLATLLPASEPDPFMRAGQASRAYQAGDYTAAEAGYRSLAHDFPSAPGFVLGLGRSLARQGRTAEALEILARAADAGAGAEASTLQEAFGTAADTPEARALLSRFRGNLTPVVRSSLAFRLGEKDLLPESVAYDPVDDVYFVGSLYKRKIVVVKNGVVRDFIPAKRDGLTSVLGMKVDVRRRELWANACNGTSPVMQEPDPRTEGRTAVFRYELGTGRLLGKYEGGRGDETLCFNDLVFSPDGDAYVSAGDGGVFRVVRPTRRLERFAPTPGLFVNGIAISADGKTLYLADHLRGVVLLDVASREVRPLPTPPGVSLAAIDGLYVHGASLVGVQNGLGEGPERVVQAFLGDDGSRVACVDLLERSHPDYDVPTTGVVVGDELVYVAGSQLNRQDDKGRPWPLERLRESAVLRLPLQRTCSAGSATARIDLEAARAELLATHEADRRAHYKTDAALLAFGSGDSFLAVRTGKIERVTTEAQRRMFEQYFAGARYEEWDDLEPPVARISDDGSMAWVVSRLKVRRTSPDAAGAIRERTFVYAGIMTYEKRGGRWVKVANVSTFE